MNAATATEWAIRLSGLKLELPRHASAIYKIIRDRVLPLGADFGRVGEEASYYMVITQSAAFRGYKDMDDSLIPPFTEGSREVTARKMLEIEDEEFVRVSQHQDLARVTFNVQAHTNEYSTNNSEIGGSLCATLKRYWAGTNRSSK